MKTKIHRHTSFRPSKKDDAPLHEAVPRSLWVLFFRYLPIVGVLLSDAPRWRQAPRFSVLPLFWLLASVLLSLGLARFGGIVSFAGAIRPFSLVFFALFVGLYLAAILALHTHKNDIRPFYQSQELMTRGVYGISRHPMYLSGIFLVLGVCLWSASYLSFLGLFVYIIPTYYFARAEERHLLAQFGDAYRYYQKQTGFVL